MGFEYVLILTKNTLNEIEIQEKLQKMNIDVFCTTNVLEGLSFSTQFCLLLDKRWLIILSETLSNREVDQIVDRLTERTVMVRKMETPPKQEALEKMKAQGIDDWIPHNPTIGVFHDLFDSNKGNVKLDEKKNIATLYKLTRKEKQLMIHLFESNGKVLSRDQLCRMLWENNESKSLDSSKVQLSVIVKNINKKFSSFFADGMMIETLWGQGYRLTDEVLQKYYI
ncbi:winged helix-turn-helix domain-containing protein [Enterococcus sp. AZ109]|uniref:winged helix-turn-helix domain-containing protein n=1 Tax=Enterococcus sp. AZ109 TaxID=2774634 RepID=UPI003F20BFAC